MKLIITVNGREITLTHEEARELYGQLKELFEQSPRPQEIDRPTLREILKRERELLDQSPNVPEHHAKPNRYCPEYIVQP